jgi:hypothetical protein
MRYRVTVQRIEYQAHDFVVTAESPDAAESLAVKLSHDHDFSGECHNAEETVINVVPLDETNRE